MPLLEAMATRFKTIATWWEAMARLDSFASQPSSPSRSLRQRQLLRAFAREVQIRNAQEEPKDTKAFEQKAAEHRGPYWGIWTGREVLETGNLPREVKSYS